MSRLLDALRDRPLVLDAAMGTRLLARGLDLAVDDPCLWNLARPDDVLDLHRRDAEAGADVLLTNTFGASPAALDRLGRAGDFGAINRRAAELARLAAGPGRLVLGSIGPVGHDRPGSTRRQAEALAEAGVDGLLLETHTPDQALRQLREHLRDGPAVPRLVSLGPPGDPDPDAARALLDLGAVALGWNCLDGMPPTLDALARLAAAVPRLAQPSAGLPGRPPATPDSFADAVPRLLALGARLIGGCCGTTEAHVAALRRAVDEATHAAP